MRCVLALSLVCGCYGPVDVLWEASFENPADDARAAFVFVDVRQDIGRLNCPGEREDIVLGPYRIKPVSPIATIPTLEDGEYCFHATAVDADCNLVAEGFIALEIPRDAVHVVMSTTTGSACVAGETCFEGRCVNDTGMPLCASPAHQYCTSAMQCCPGRDEADACDYYESTTFGCTDPI